MGIATQQATNHMKLFDGQQTKKSFPVATCPSQISAAASLAMPKVGAA
jgi:hypothetical protein